MLAIDAGERRVGIALSDESRLLARPVAVLDRQQGLPPVMSALANLVQAEGVSCVVVGLPLNADGSEGRQAKRARHFAQLTRRILGMPVVMWDERLSTQEAESIVRLQGKRPRQRQDVDAVAAAVILQAYLDSHNAQRGSSSGDPGRASDPDTAAKAGKP